MESFGTRLKREREQRKITLDDISVSTKIGTRFLVALEEDHFDQLPGGVFNKGFVRAYAHHLGLDEAQAIADFEAASKPVLPEIDPLEAPELAAMAVRVPPSRSNRGDGGIPWEAFAVALLALALGFALWGFHSREKSARPSVPVAPSTPSETSAATLQPVAANSAPPAAPASQQSEPSAGSAAAAPAPAEVLAGTTLGVFQVLVKAREDSWVAITADGKQVVQDTLTAPAEKSVAARDQIVIKTGNVGALDISFNGKKLAQQGRYNEVKTLTFDPGGLKP